MIDRIGAGGGAPEEPIPSQVLGQLPITAETLTAIQESLFRVTTAGWGTATDKFVELRVPVAGKTGTAEAANLAYPTPGLVVMPRLALTLWLMAQSSPPRKLPWWCLPRTLAKVQPSLPPFSAVSLSCIMASRR